MGYIDAGGGGGTVDLPRIGEMVTAERVKEAMFDDGGEWGSIITDDEGDPPSSLCFVYEPREHVH